MQDTTASEEASSGLENVLSPTEIGILKIHAELPKTATEERKKERKEDKKSRNNPITARC